MAILGGAGITYLDQDPNTEGLTPNEANPSETEWAWDTVGLDLYYWSRIPNTWVLFSPGGGGGNGIYGGSDTVPTTVTATLTDTINFASGEVGIATASPSQALSVTGRIYLDDGNGATIIINGS
jgi:hypothetical protein